MVGGSISVKGRAPAAGVGRHRFADVHIGVKPRNADDVAGHAEQRVAGLHTGIFKDLGYLDALFAAVFAQQIQGVAGFDRAAEHATHGNTANKVTPLNVADQHAERGVFDHGWRHGAQHCFKQCIEPGARPVDLVVGPAIATAGVQERCGELVFGGAQFQKQLEHFIVDFLGAGMVAVHLIDDNDWLQAVVQCFAQHKAGLGLGSVGGVHQQQHAVDHLHHAFDLGAEVGVARCIDDVDDGAIPQNRRVLGLDGDPLFTFEVHRVHDPFLDLLVVAEDPALA
jgi:hypothetical protein